MRHRSLLQSVQWHSAAADLCTAGGPQALCATRFLVGVGQGCVDASIVDSISRWSPMEERSKSSGLAFNGYNGGMVIGEPGSTTLYPVFSAPAIGCNVVALASLAGSFTEHGRAIS